MSDLAALLARFPRLGLAQLPTPLEPLKRLTAHLGGPRIWIKRDDATGLGFGGNKLRKLDTVLAEAMAAKADTLVSGGVVQSNSQRQVAAAAAKLGLECHLAVYHGRVAPPTPEYDRSGNAFLNRLFGAHLHDVPWTGDRNAAIQTSGGGSARPRASGCSWCPMAFPIRWARWAMLPRSWKSRSSRAPPGFIPPRSFIAAAAAAPRRDLTVGASVALKETRIVGIDIDAEPARVRAEVASCAKGAADLLGVTFSESAIEVVGGACRSGLWRAACGHHRGDQAGGRAGRPGARSGLYRQGAGGPDRAGAGRALAARTKHVIFLHTGGAPALFAYESALGI